MSKFHWKGRTRDGHDISGQIEAPSKDEAVIRLQGNGVVVTSIDGNESDGSVAQPADLRPPDNRHKRPTPFRGLFIAAVFVLIAGAIGAFLPITTFDCKRQSGDRADCTIDERVLGLYSLRQQSIRGVTAIDSPSSRRERFRVVIHNDMQDSISAYGDRRAESALSTWVSDQYGSPHLRKRSITWVPLLLAGVCLFLGALTAVFSLLAFFAGPTEWVYARTAQWKAEAEEKLKNPDE